MRYAAALPHTAAALQKYKYGVKLGGPLLPLQLCLPACLLLPGRACRLEPSGCGPPALPSSTHPLFTPSSSMQCAAIPCSARRLHGAGAAAGGRARLPLANPRLNSGHTRQLRPVGARALGWGCGWVAGARWRDASRGFGIGVGRVAAAQARHVCWQAKACRGGPPTSPLPCICLLSCMLPWRACCACCAGARRRCCSAWRGRALR